MVKSDWGSSLVSDVIPVVKVDFVSVKVERPWDKIGDDGWEPFNFSQKLKLLKAELKRWNKETFGDVSKMAEASKEKLGKIQEKISLEGFSELLHQEELSIQEELNVALSLEEKLAKDGSRIKWLREGDRNTKFLHTMAKIKGVKAFIAHVLIDGEVIPRLVTTADNEILCKLSDVEEIKGMFVFGLDGASSPGPDGFAGSFYHHCWDISNDDLVDAVQPFLSMVDTKKAFDTLRWDFPLEVLKVFGLSLEFVGWIENTLHACRISILFNGSPAGFF
ncbi:hypothetical protein L484_007669 [Morus notabilis]|uniref:Reverse transcriptase domain-containing protein n=1 Tax=Morus notabilis TaxID=981085 RepID=W9RER9_9ROSA|nr:hypothetical protein L484_007669 [Morus notabilis]